jgi:hypothetical protein
MGSDDSVSPSAELVRKVKFRLEVNGSLIRRVQKVPLSIEVEGFASLGINFFGGFRNGEFEGLVMSSKSVSLGREAIKKFR